MFRRFSWSIAFALLAFGAFWVASCQQQRPAPRRAALTRVASRASQRSAPKRPHLRKRLRPSLRRPSLRLIPTKHKANLWHVGAAKEFRHLELLHVVTTKTHAYACTAVQGFQVYDIRTPTRPKEVGEYRFPLPYGGYNKPGCRYVALDGKVAYVSNTINALQPLPFVAAIDVSKPRLPQVLAYFHDKRFNLSQLIAKDSMVYVTAFQGGLLALRLSQTAPLPRPVTRPSTRPSSRPTSRPDTHRSLRDTLRRTARLALGTGRRNSSRHRLQLVSRLGGFQNAQGIARHGELLLVADGPGGLKIVALSKAGRPTGIVAHHPTRGFARRVAVYKGHAYVSEGSSGFSVFDLRNPQKPRRIAQVSTPYSVVQIALARDFAFVANWNDLRVYHIKRPAKPILAAIRAFPRRKDTFRLPYEKSLTQIRNASLAVRFPHVILGEWLGLRVLQFAPHPVPIFQANTSAIQLPTTPPKTKAQARILIQNKGNATLYVTGARLRPQTKAFALHPRQLKLPPGASQTLTLTFSPKRHGMRRAKLELTTNDPHQQRVTMAVQAPTRARKGSVHRDFVLQDIDGRTHQLSKLRGKVVLLSYFATF